MGRIEQKAADLQQARQQVETNRAQWTTVLKPLLIEQLTAVKNAFPLGWSLSHGDSAWTNIDHVSLSFDNTNSGIVEIKTGQPVVRQGGGLFFGQLANGKIVVLIVYPAIGDFAKASTPKQLGPFDPAEIDADFVEEMLVEFLDEMIKWEQNGEPDEPHIGFRS